MLEHGFIKESSSIPDLSWFAQGSPGIIQVLALKASCFWKILPSQASRDGWSPYQLITQKTYK